MHFTKIYIQENYIPNYDLDPFHRKWIGGEVSLSEGEDVDKAIAMAEEKVAAHIKANTILPSGEMKGTHVKYVDAEQEEQMQNEFLEFAEKLKALQFREDAQAFLDTTSWRYAVQAKEVVNNLPSKNK